MSVLPIAAFVIILALSATDIDGGIVALFAAGALFSVFGIGFFTLGADMALMPMGSSVGARLSKTKSKTFVFAVCFALGAIITIAEPDLQVLAGQLHDGPGVNQALVYSVAAGVGLFMIVSLLRTYFNFKLKHILVVAYGIVIILTAVMSAINPAYVPLSFDSGGVTTGPVTVPFLLSLCIGIAAVRGGRSNDDSFGAVALCSIGPIMAVLILGLSGQLPLNHSVTAVPDIQNAADMVTAFAAHLPEHAKGVLIALSPIAAVFFIFQIFTLKLPKTQIIRIIVGIIYSYAGLVIFLTAANTCFVPMGSLLGGAIGSSSYKWLLIPAGFVIGILIVLAEPAVHVLNKQVEDITSGAITKKTMLVCLCIAVALALAMSMTRVLTGISILWFIIPVYVCAVTLSFFVPAIFTGIAFDSGGVASGAMATALVLPFAIGACAALGGDIFTDAFGLVAFVAMMPLITIQLLGLIYKIKLKNKSKSRSETAADIIEASEDRDEDNEEDIIDFDDELKYGAFTVITQKAEDIIDGGQKGETEDGAANDETEVNAETGKTEDGESGAEVKLGTKSEHTDGNSGIKTDLAKEEQRNNISGAEVQLGTKSEHTCENFGIKTDLEKEEQGNDISGAAVKLGTKSEHADGISEIKTDLEKEEQGNDISGGAIKLGTKSEYTCENFGIKTDAAKEEQRNDISGAEVKTSEKNVENTDAAETEDNS
jgi:hypothetical protein